METDLKKVCLVSLGCAKNLVDAEMMLGFLKKDGFGFTTAPVDADVIVVNTCGFVEDSKKESISQILEMAKFKNVGAQRAAPLLVVTGCLTQRYSEQLSKEMPEVDLFVGLGEFDKIAKLVRERFVGAPLGAPSVGVQLQQRVYVNREQILPDPDLPRVLATPGHYSYLKISEGCSHICSFCIIPAIRGRLKSRPIDSIVREVKELIEQGVKEFNMIAQDLNEYGRDLKDGTNLAKLLSEIDALDGDFWLRPLYMYPLEFNDRLIDVLKNAKHIVKYVDMPLQHISEKMLLSMKRGSPSRYVRQLLEKLKTAMPEIAIRTTFIVGYPGETEEDFQELYDFVEETEFDRVGVFKYSIEEGTTAALLDGQLPQEVKDERYHRLMSLQKKVSLKKNKKLVGKTFRVLCDEKFARLSTQAPEIDGVTFITKGKSKPGEFATVKITKATDYDLLASIVSQTPSASKGGARKSTRS